MVHVYYGDGKGKTTAAMGLALRAAGAGWRVVAVQFLKDGTSSEISALAQLPGVAAVLHDGAQAKFTFRMSEQERQASRALHDANLGRALGLMGCEPAGPARQGCATGLEVAPEAAPAAEAAPASGHAETPAAAVTPASEGRPAPCASPAPCLLVLDEALDALRAGLLDEGLLARALAWAHGSAACELVVTGHSLPDAVAAQADYLTHFACERHPYAAGVAARLGVEY